MRSSTSSHSRRRRCSTPRGASKCLPMASRTTTWGGGGAPTPLAPRRAIISSATNSRIFALRSSGRRRASKATCLESTASTTAGSAATPPPPPEVEADAEAEDLERPPMDGIGMTSAMAPATIALDDMARFTSESKGAAALPKLAVAPISSAFAKKPPCPAGERRAEGACWLTASASRLRGCNAEANAALNDPSVQTRSATPPVARQTSRSSPKSGASCAEQCTHESTGASPPPPQSA
mmetsp:Transcript_59670/g.194682  ORF Transcript_59670/g.194682 Transcript_59670/m.194682 type:complete len:238 (+) Transcript_59670:994-1707(+)